MIKRLNKLLTVLMCLAMVGPAYAQEEAPLRIRFVPAFNNSTFTTLPYQPTHQNPAQATLEVLRFYVSGIRLLHQGRPMWVEPMSYHLIDATDSVSLEMKLAIPAGLHYDAIAFDLGIDSLTNAQGAKSGVLDATRGMYWAWHSGYINLKLEGASPLCTTRKHEFKYHLGGFRASEYALQTVTLPTQPGQAIRIQADVATLLKAINLAAEPAVMSPGSRGMALSQVAASMFSLMK